MESDAFQETFKLLKQFGLLMLSDAQLPSITTLVAGKPIRGSWWGHPKAHDIFRVVSRIAEHPDVAVTKLIAGKITFVHRKLWPALLAVATAREAWQMKGLSRKARILLQMVNKEGGLRADQLPHSRKAKRSPWNDAIRELEQRLLLYAEEFHSESGAHVKRVESWEHWAQRLRLSAKMIPNTAKQEFENLIEWMNINHKTNGRLPWR